MEIKSQFVKIKWLHPDGYNVNTYALVIRKENLRYGIFFSEGSYDMCCKLTGKIFEAAE